MLKVALNDCPIVQNAHRNKTRKFLPKISFAQQQQKVASRKILPVKFKSLIEKNSNIEKVKSDTDKIILKRSGKIKPLWPKQSTKLSDTEKKISYQYKSPRKPLLVGQKVKTSPQQLMAANKIEIVGVEHSQHSSVTPLVSQKSLR